MPYPKVEHLPPRKKTRGEKTKIKFRGTLRKVVKGIKDWDARGDKKRAEKKARFAAHR